MAKLQDKLEELLLERERSTKRMARMQSMVDNKARQQDGWSKSETVHKDYQSEVFRWNNEIWMMGAELSTIVNCDQLDHIYLLTTYAPNGSTLHLDRPPGFSD